MPVQGTVRGTAEAAAKASVAPSPRSPILLRETIGSVAVLTLNRPAARNSLSEAMIAGLHQALTEIADEKNVRALVIAANGPAFSAGHDMKEMTARRADPDRGRAYFAQLMNACSAMMQAIVQLPNLAVASEAAGFATPGVDIGLFCSTPMVALSRNVPRKQAMEMLLTGELIPAETARDIGLVNRVVAAGSERDAAIALAAKIAQKSAHTIKLGKQAFYRQAEMSLADAYRYAAEVMTENMLACDAEEGIGAFIEKRAPKWQDR